MQDEGSSNSYGVAAGELRSFIERYAVSYTHLTLPTILRV